MSRDYKDKYEYNYSMPEGSGIYEIINNINGYGYVGQAQWLPSRAILLDHDHNVPLQKAYEKYGIENFSIILLEECPIECLDNREIYWIKKLNTYINSENSKGYNLTEGGHSFRGYKFTEEQLERLSNSRKGNRNALGGKGNRSERTDEYRTKISNTLKLKYSSGDLTPHNKGIAMTSEQRNKLSKRLKGRVHSEESNRMRSETMKGRKKPKEFSDKMKDYRGSYLYTRVCTICGNEYKTKGNRSKYCDKCRGLL